MGKYIFINILIIILLCLLLRNMNYNQLVYILLNLKILLF